MKRTIASGVIGIVAISGGVDASILNEQPIPLTEVHLKEEVVTLEQNGNVIESQMPWRDQAGLKVKYDLGEPTVAERLLDKRKKGVITETVDIGDGGFKIDVILNEKPDTNTFCYTIEGAENYDFFLQPALTAEEIAEGASRPEEIVGSYAVYHKTLANHKVGGENYATGKVMHIPFPYVWETDNATATRQRAENMTYQDGQLCVVVQQDFLDNATYPVRVDPTFGYTTIGGTQILITPTTNPTGFLNGSYTAITGDIATKISVYCHCSSGGGGDRLLEVANYTITAGLPDVRQDTSYASLPAFNDSSPQWRDSPTYSLALVAGTTYNASAVVNTSGGGSGCAGGANAIYIYRDTTSGAQRSLHNATGALPAVWVSSGTTASTYSAYTTYTAGTPSVSDTPKAIINGAIINGAQI